MKRLIVIASLIATSINANAFVFFDGNKLMSLDRAMRTAYITGVVDTINVSSVMRGGKVNSLCLPDNVTAGQLHDIVMKHYTDNPSVRHIEAPLTITLVISLAFCPK